jgi:hypothetical protein
MLLASLLLFAAPARAIPTEALLDSLQYTAFRYMWDQANPANGLIKDRSTFGSASSIAAVGFGLTTICIGVDHGWVTREAARSRVLTTLSTFWSGTQSSAATGTIGYKGLFYHFLDMNTATRAGSGVELSTIDTALLLAGILDTREYFTNNDPDEVLIRALADSINRRVDWKFTQNFNPGILMGWKPGTGFAGYGQWIGYNEAMIMYILALGAPVPSRAVAPSAWTQWTSGYNWNNQYGYTYLIFPPLFGHQYSHCWIDFRYIQDAYMQTKGITYFENSRRATLAQRAYAVANPGGFVGYQDSLWGLTASDYPGGYNARGAPPGQNDDGTIVPTAPLSSIPFAPEATIPVAHYLYDHYKPQLWGPYGFRDAFNLTVNWWATDVLGIDQGPIAIMIENYRTRSVWNRFMANPDVQRGLQAAGFVASVGVPPAPRPARLALEPPSPNPFAQATTLRYRLDEPGRVRLVVFDLGGREVARLVDAEQPAGAHQASFAPRGLPAGIYHVRLECNGSVASRRIVRIE